MHLRSVLAGIFLTLALGATGLAVLGWFTGESGTFSPLARLIDAFLPFFTGLGLGSALLAWIFGIKRLGALLTLLCVILSGLLAQSYYTSTISIASDKKSQFSVLFFNVLETNNTAPGSIIEAVIERAPDIVVLAEAEAVRSALPQLREAYSFVSPCPEESCELLVATRLPQARFWRMQLNPVWPERYAVLEVNLPEGPSVLLAANHLAKPWMSGVATSEVNRLIAQYNWLTGPAVVVGDFNMAPWSAPMRRIFKETDFRALRGQPASWPAFAGGFGLPIDQVLVRQGVVATGISSFGRGLGSNHLGFIVQLAVLADER